MCIEIVSNHRVHNILKAFQNTCAPKKKILSDKHGGNPVIAVWALGSRDPRHGKDSMLLVVSQNDAESKDIYLCAC